MSNYHHFKKCEENYENYDFIPEPISTVVLFLVEFNANDQFMIIVNVQKTPSFEKDAVWN
jgi:hypothetical protein